MKTFVVGDIHGAHKALVQVLQRAGFDYNNHRLIVLGDISDGWPETPECVEEILKIKHRVVLRGNHDMWTTDWMLDGITDSLWLEFGGRATYHAYLRTGLRSNVRHLRFWKNLKPYYIDKKNRLFVHAGYNPNRPFEEQSEKQWLWNRSLFETALKAKKKDVKRKDVNDFKEVFIGHTNLRKYFKHDRPVKATNVWNLDTSVKKGGPLTLMNVKTKEYWQSDPADVLYLLSDLV